MARNRLTVLQIVQRTLDAMNHDSVNSISDTVEAQQIAEEARVVYYDLMDRDDWPHLMQLIPLTGLGDTTKPNFMSIPQNIVRIDDVRYNVRETTDSHDRYEPIDYLAPEDFLDKVFSRRSDQSDITTVLNSNNVKMFITNDVPPQWWTTFDDENIVFDAFDSAMDTTLQGSKSLVRAKVIPDWTSGSDTFIPDMPDHMFSVYLSEVTAAAFTYWKQGASVKDEQRAARGISRLRKDARKVDEIQRRAKFGRKRFTVVRRTADERGN